MGSSVIPTPQRAAISDATRLSGIPVGQPAGPEQMGAEIPVPQPEPGQVAGAELGQGVHGGPRLARQPPTGLGVDGPGQGVGDGVQIRADVEAVEDDVVAGIDDGGDLSGIDDVDQPPQHPGGSDAAGQCDEHAWQATAAGNAWRLEPGAPPLGWPPRDPSRRRRHAAHRRADRRRGVHGRSDQRTVPAGRAATDRLRRHLAGAGSAGRPAAGRRAGVPGPYGGPTVAGRLATLRRAGHRVVDRPDRRGARDQLRRPADRPGGRGGHRARSHLHPVSRAV